MSSKKPAAKKPVAKKAAAKKPVAKKPASKKPAAKKPAAKKPEDKGKVPHRVPPRIIRRPSPNARAPEGDYVPVDTAKAVAFGMSAYLSLYVS